MKFVNNFSNVTKRKSHFKICDPGLDIKHCVKSAQIRSFFWSAFFCIQTEYGDLLLAFSCNRTEYGDLRSKSPYSVRMQ